MGCVGIGVWDVLSFGIGVCCHRRLGCVVIGDWDVLHFGLGCVEFWDWDVLSLGVGPIGTCYHWGLGCVVACCCLCLARSRCIGRVRVHSTGMRAMPPDHKQRSLKCIYSSCLDLLHAHRSLTPWGRAQWHVF